MTAILLLIWLTQWVIHLVWRVANAFKPAQQVL
jgi:hypothetical protein